MKESVKSKILVVDDEKLNRQVIADLLSPKFTIIAASNATQALERAHKHLPDLILLDIMMPEVSGYEVIRQLKSNSVTQHIPVIFLTGLADESDEETGLVLGAVDYITKPLHPKIVACRVNIHIELVEQRRKLEAMTNADGLTGISNRRKFDNALIYEWKRCQRSGSSLGIAMIDVDFFKPYNDNYGHSAGDAALKMVANALTATLKRSTDLCARYGGEEFAMILPETCEKGVSTILERCRAAVEDLQIPHFHSRAGDTLTVSIGGAWTIPTGNCEAAELLKQADARLYRAKELGRNTVVMHEAADHNMKHVAMG